MSTAFPERIFTLAHYTPYTGETLADMEPAVDTVSDAPSLCPCQTCCHDLEKQRRQESRYPQAAYWRHRLRLKGTPWTLSGHSRALERTGFFLEEPKVFLDAGVAFKTTTNGNSNAILVTHTHIDHINALQFLLRTPSDPAVLIPRQHLNQIREYTRLSWGIKGEDGSKRAGTRVDVEHGPTIPTSLGSGVVTPAEEVGVVFSG